MTNPNDLLDAFIDSKNYTLKTARNSYAWAKALEDGNEETLAMLSQEQPSFLARYASLLDNTLTPGEITLLLRGELSSCARQFMEQHKKTISEHTASVRKTLEAYGAVFDESFQKEYKRVLEKLNARIREKT